MTEVGFGDKAVYGMVNDLADLSRVDANVVEGITEAMVSGSLSLGDMISQQIKLQMATAKLDITKGSAKVLTGQIAKVGQAIGQIS